MAPFVTMAANQIKLVSVNVQAGAECTVEIQVDNTDPFVAFQADIPLPQGLVYVAGSAVLNTQRTDGHTLSASVVDQTLRILAYSPSNIPFTGTTGTLVTFRLKSGNVPGTYALIPQNTLLGSGQSLPLDHAVVEGAVTILGPNIHHSPDALDFGRVALTTSSTLYVNVTNQGNQELVISELTFTDSQFSSPESGGFTLAAGSSRQVSIIFTPTQKGTLAKQMSIKSNDPDAPNLNIPINAIAYAVNELHMSPFSASSGSNGKLSFSINNMETFTGFQFDIQLPDPLIYAGAPLTLLRNTDHIVQANLIADKVLRVVAISPGGQVFTGTSGTILEIDLTVDGTAGYYYINPQNVIIASPDGVNILSATYGNQVIIQAPDIDASTFIEFGDVSVTAAGEQMLRVYNYGQEPLNITGMSFSSEYFSSGQNLPLEVQSYNYKDIPVKFTKTTKGVASGKLQIFSNDPDEYPYVVDLSGNAYVPNIITVENTEAFQGTTALVNLQVDNLELFTAMQLDLSHHASLVPVLDSIQLSARKQDHQYQAVALDANTIRLVVYSGSQQTITGTSGIVMTIPFRIPPEMAPAGYALSVSNGILSDLNASNILYSTTNGVLTVKVFTTNIDQVLTMNAGWNIFSTRALPDNPDMKVLFQPLIDNGMLVKIMDEEGKSLENYGIFGGWTNNIGNISPTKGYKIMVGDNCQVTLNGLPVAYPYAIPLATGWNIMGFPHDIEIDGKTIIQELIDRGTLVKVQDEKGNSIENWGVFGGWTNNIGNFIPGKGYKILLSAADQISIAEIYPKSATANPPAIAALAHYRTVYPGNGVDHMNINIVGLSDSFLKPGDEIAVFDGEQCVGAVKLLPVHIMEGRVSVPVSANDDFGNPGFLEGNPYQVKLWSMETGKEMATDPDKISGPEGFLKNESVFLSLEKYGIHGQNENDALENMVLVYPNPTSGTITISLANLPSEPTGVKIMNASGQTIWYQILEGKEMIVDLSGNPPGMYIVNVIQSTFTKTEKILLK